jgi:hypothetical protein
MNSGAILQSGRSSSDPIADGGGTCLYLDMTDDDEACFDEPVEKAE